MGNLVLKPFGIPPASEAALAPHSEEELRQLLSESHKGGLLAADETRLVPSEWGRINYIGAEASR